jgi:hypothetical protein
MAKEKYTCGVATCFTCLKKYYQENCKYISGNAPAVELQMIRELERTIIGYERKEFAELHVVSWDGCKKTKAAALTASLRHTRI